MKCEWMLVRFDIWPCAQMQCGSGSSANGIGFKLPLPRASLKHVDSLFGCPNQKSRGLERLE